MMIVDLRPINKEQPYNKINSVLDQLSKKWDQREVMPPYIDVISKHFSSNTMRKPASYVPLLKKGGQQTMASTQKFTPQKGARK